MVLPPLIIKGILFLSLNVPQSLPIKSNQIWFSKPGIVRAEVLGSQLILKGEKEGFVYAAGLGSPLQKIVVLDASTFKALKSCGITALDFSEDLPHIQNSLFSEATLHSLKICGFEGLGITKEAQTKALHEIMQREGLLQKSGIRIIKNFWNEQGQREISIANSESSNSVGKARSLLGDISVIYKFSTVPQARPGRTLIFESTLFEYSRSKARTLGLRFPENIRLWPLEAGALSEADGSALSIGLDFGEKEGVGKVLARPKIRTQPGQKALFQSGGEIPVKNENLHSSTTVWKPYGLQIEIEPDANLAIGSSEVSLSFKIEVSEPDFGKAINGVPSISMRKLQNRFDLRTNEITILTSLIQLRKGKNEKGISGFRELPLFGGLFDNHNSQESESELYFALKPSWEEI